MNCDVGPHQNLPGCSPDHQSEDSSAQESVKRGSSLWPEDGTLRNFDILLDTDDALRQSEKVTSNDDDLKKVSPDNSPVKKEKCEVSFIADEPANAEPFDSKSVDDLPSLYNRADDRSVDSTETETLTLISGTSRSRGGTLSLGSSPRRQVDIRSPQKPPFRIQALRSKMGWLSRSMSQRSCVLLEDEEQDDLSSIGSSEHGEDYEDEDPEETQEYVELSSDEEDVFTDEDEDVNVRYIGIQDSLHLARRKIGQLPSSLEIALHEMDDKSQEPIKSASVHSEDAVDTEAAPAAGRTTSQAMKSPRRNRKRRTVIDLPKKKEVAWEKPEWTSSRSALKPTARRSNRKPIGWEKPSWTTDRDLKPTGKADVLRTKGNLAKPITMPPGKGDGINREALPEQVLKRKGCRIAKKKNIEWEKPIWRTESTLTTSEKGQALKLGVDAVRPAPLHATPSSIENEDKAKAIDEKK